MQSNRFLSCLAAFALGLLLLTAQPAFARTVAYDFVWYSGADRPWVVEAGAMAIVEVSEDTTTPENDILLRVRNQLFTPLSHESGISEIQIDTGTTAPDLMESVEIDLALSNGEFRVWTYPPGAMNTLIDRSVSRIAWTAEFAAGRPQRSQKEDGINRGEWLVLRARLKPGVTFDDVVASMDVGASSTHLAGYYSQWSTAQRNLYRAEATKGLRLAILFHSTVPNSWDPDGHGLFVTHRRVEAPTAPMITAASATPATILDTQTSALAATAVDPQPGPQPLSYQWTVVSGGGSVSPATGASVVYTPPDVSAPRTAVLRVAVSDGESTVTRDVTVQVNDAGAAPPNLPPSVGPASATPSTIWEGQQSQLAVTATDTDGPQPLSYAWEIVNGGGTLSNAALRNPVYSAPADVVGTQTVTLRVTVSDGAASVVREVTVTVQDAVPPPPGTPILTQDFGVNNFDGWAVVDEGTISAPSKWRIVGGELVQQTNIRDGGKADDLPKLGTYLIHLDGFGWTDYRARFRMRSTDDDGLGLMFRVIDNDHWYRFSWDRQLQQRRLVKKAGGAYTLLAADNVPYEMGRSYQVEVVAQGSLLEVWIDGARVFLVEDAALPRGSVAFYTWQNNAAYFDDLVVEDLSGGTFNRLPVITTLTATPATILDTQTSQLLAAATDSDGPAALTYRWTIVSGGGSLSSATAPNPVYTPADVVGTQTVKLKVEVSDGAATVHGNLTLRVEDANPPPLGALLLSNDFGDAGALAGWTVVDEGTLTAPSKWRVVGGELVQQSNIRDGNTANQLPKLGTYLRHDGGAAWTDYRVRFKLRATDDDSLGVMFRLGDANNYYRFSWNRQLGQRQLVKRVGGAFTLLAADNVPYVMGQAYDVEIVAEGSRLEVWIDGVRVFDVSDASLVQGGIAFYTWQHSAAFFDQLRVHAID